MKAIILAGGRGSRMYPATIAISKHLFLIYDKPMIYYSFSIALMAGINKILIIAGNEHIEAFRNLFGDGSSLGIHIEYRIQDEPRGIAEAFIIGEKFIGNDSVCLILGDNFFYGDSFVSHLIRLSQLKEGAGIFAYHEKKPEEFGVVEFDKTGRVLSIKEKSKDSNSNYVVPGVYFYDNQVVEIAKSIKPSKRGELEITAVNNVYLEKRKLKVEVLPPDVKWLDTGSYETLLEASNFVKLVQTKTGKMISCLEEISYKNRFIGKSEVAMAAEKYKGTQYSEYLLSI